MARFQRLFRQVTTFIVEQPVAIAAPGDALHQNAVRKRKTLLAGNKDEVVDYLHMIGEVLRDASTRSIGRSLDGWHL